MKSTFFFPKLTKNEVNLYLILEPKNVFYVLKNTVRETLLEEIQCRKKQSVIKYCENLYETEKGVSHLSTLF